MCQRIHAVFRCADAHQAASQPRDRFKYVRDCATFRASNDCGVLQRVHDPEEDEGDVDCTECRPKPTTESTARSPRHGMEPEDPHLWSQFLRESGDTGCQRCRMGHSHAFPCEFEDLERLVRRGCNYAQMILNGLKQLGFERPVEEIVGDHVKFHGIDPRDWYSERRIQFFIHQAVGTPWTELGWAIPIVPDPLANSCIQQIRVWLQECMESHDACRSSESWSLPTRVIDVTSGHHGTPPRLYTSKGESLPYTTLSYRWGSAMTCLTTTGNLAKMQQAIDVDTMPATFRDAILLTRRLGVRYIWIDALCIIQDDIEDWRRESGRMASIYGSSVLTISATSSSSPSDGLSPKRPPTTTYEQTDLNGAKHVVHIRDLILHGNQLNGARFWNDSDDAMYPTLSRGWCFQERLLSRRVLHFTYQEMVWDCRCCRRCECGEAMVSDYSLLRNFYEFHTTLSTPGNDSDRPAGDPGVRPWAQLLIHFSNTHLTYDRDMLPAISGMAQRLSNTTLGRYFAGLWEFKLIDQLRWTAHGSSSSQGYGRAPTQYTAPSFSPLSRIGGIMGFNMRWDDSGRPRPRVLDVQVTLDGSDPTGAVSDGHLELHGTLLCLRATEKPTVKHMGRLMTMCNVPSGKAIKMAWVPDTDNIEVLVKPFDELFLLQFDATFSLVLRRREGKDGFIRIGSLGAGYEHNDAISEEAVSKTVTIY